MLASGFMSRSFAQLPEGLWGAPRLASMAGDGTRVGALFSRGGPR